MQKLDPTVKATIVNKLAIFETPAQVAECIQRRFGITVTPQAIQAYDPGTVNGRRLGGKWRSMFEQAREKYLAAMSDRAMAGKLGAMAIESVAEHLDLDRVGL